MADTAAALVIQLSADFKDFKKQMQAATGVFDSEGRKIERRQAQLKKSLSNWALDFSGLKGLGAAFAGITAAAAVVGIGDLVKKSLDAAAAIGDVAKQAGVSVETLQKLRFAASQSGASFDVLDTGLTTLNKTFGEFVNTGAGRGKDTFKILGIDKLINSGQVRDTEQLFNVLVSKISGFGSEAQKSAFLASVFGKEAGPKLLQLINQGSAGIAELEAKAISLGIVLSTKTVQDAKEANDKLSALFDVIKSEGIAAVANLAPEIAKLAQAITDGLPDLITWVEKWAAFFGLINLDPVQQAKVAVQGLSASLAGLKKQRDEASGTNPLSIFGLTTSKEDLGALIDAEVAKLEKAKAELADAQKNADLNKKPGGLQAGAAFLPKLHVNDIQGNKEAALLAEQQKEAKLRAAETLDRTVTDAKTAQAALSAAQNQTSVQLLKGSDSYQAAVQKQINDEYKSKVDVIKAEEVQAQAALDKQRNDLAKRGVQWQGYATAVFNINQEMNDKIAAADEERKQKQFETSPAAIIQGANEQGRQQIQQLQDETAAIGLDAGALAKLVFEQQALAEARARQKPITAELIAAIKEEGDAVGKAAKQAHEAQVGLGRSIQATDELRSGLEDVGVAGLHGFSSLADAAKNFIGQIAEMIFRLGVLRPLLDGLLGEQGTLGSGPLGGIFSAGGGFFNTIANQFGGGSLALNTSAAIAANPLLFADGGFTGQGGKDQPAGVVHKGEYVFDQKAVRRIGVPALTALHKGYADGGLVGASQQLPSLPSVMPTGHKGAALSFYIDARYASRGVAEEIQDRLIKLAPVMVKAAVETSRREFPSNLSNTLRDKA